jgi:hypothetical protein
MERLLDSPLLLGAIIFGGFIFFVLIASVVSYLVREKTDGQVATAAATTAGNIATATADRLKNFETTLRGYELQMKSLADLNMKLIHRVEAIEKVKPLPTRLSVGPITIYKGKHKKKRKHRDLPPPLPSGHLIQPRARGKRASEVSQ